MEMLVRSGFERILQVFDDQKTTLHCQGIVFVLNGTIANCCDRIVYPALAI